MHKIIFNITCIFLVFLLFSNSNGRKSSVDNAINLQVTDRNYLEFEKKEIRLQSFKNKVQEIIDTLYWYQPDNEYPWGYWPSLDTFTQPNDTIITWFWPIAECSLLAIECKWHTAGTIELHVWDDTTLNDTLGNLDKDLIPPTQWSVNGDDYYWQTFDLRERGVSCVVPYSSEDGGFFYVGFVLNGSGIGVDPQICWEQPWDHSLESGAGRYGYWRVHLHPPVVSSGWYPLRWVTLTGDTLYFELLLRAIVKYNATPPNISEMTQLCDTYNKTGPFKVIANVEDADGTVGAAYLRYTTTVSGISDSVEMSLDPIHASNCTAEAFINGSFQIGDTILYDIRAIDNDYSSGFSGVKYFIICEPQNPDAEILIVNDHGGNRDWFYGMVLSDHTIDKEYEVWKIDKHRGIDSSVIDYGWPTIIWFGYEVSYIPAKDYNSPVTPFLGNGHSLFLASPDYFYHNDISPDVWTDFGPGDFAYEYLGVASCMSDPGFTTGESLGDTAFIGKSGDPISNNWIDAALVINNANWGLLNWADYVRARSSAVDIFWGAGSGARCGVRYEGANFYTVFVPWVYEAIVSYEDAVTFMRNILTWFGRVKGVEEATVSNLIYRVYQNNPNPFTNVTCICYEIPMKATVSLKIFDVTGRLIKNFSFVEQKPGKHEFTFEASELKAGVYFYSVEAGNFKATQKMLIIK